MTKKTTLIEIGTIAVLVIAAVWFAKGNSLSFVPPSLSNATMKLTFTPYSSQEQAQGTLYLSGAPPNSTVELWAQEAYDGQRNGGIIHVLNATTSSTGTYSIYFGTTGYVWFTSEATGGHSNYVLLPPTLQPITPPSPPPQQSIFSQISNYLSGILNSLLQLIGL